MKKIILAFTIISNISYAQYKDIPFKNDIILSPNVNEISSKNIGESLFKNINVIKKKGLKIVNVPEFKIYGKKHNLDIGDILSLESTKDNELYFINIDNPSTEGYFGIITDEQFNYKRTFWTAHYPLIRMGLIKKEIENVEFEITDYLNSDCNSCYSFEFIYNGKSNNTLKFIYREFIKDLARPSFTQDLQYDLEESNIVGFKDMRIEIIKATNSAIDYKILNHLN